MIRFSLANWDKGVFAEFDTRNQAAAFRRKHQEEFFHVPVVEVLQLKPSVVETGVIYRIGEEVPPAPAPDPAFVTINTTNKDGSTRRVTISCSKSKGNCTLLGNLEHGTVIVVDQKLVDDLQKLVNIQKGG